ncbi:MAG: 30S ribosome-binding factor RbfA [Endozoicomonadaceae bacterium]|nr:30S ribosome-binding factor RbfA [Endozoicomonadaceae bacterium]
MFRGFSRTQRVADQIQRNVANILQMEMRDARLGMVTINEVKVSTDLSYADIYVTFMGIDDDQNGFKEQIKILT